MTYSSGIVLVLDAFHEPRRMTRAESTGSRTTTSAPSGDQSEIHLWPSEAVAARAFDIANSMLVLALIVGVIATAVVVWMGNTKEAYLKKALADVNNQAARANERAEDAKANAEAEKVERLKLEAQIAPRSLSIEQQAELTRALTPFSGKKIVVSSMTSDGESLWLATQILNAVKAAGVIAIDARGWTGLISGNSFGVNLAGGNVHLVTSIKNVLESTHQPITVGGYTASTLLPQPSGPPADAVIWVATKPLPNPK